MLVIIETVLRFALGILVIGKKVYKFKVDIIKKLAIIVKACPSAPEILVLIIFHRLAIVLFLYL